MTGEDGDRKGSEEEERDVAAGFPRAKKCAEMFITCFSAPGMTRGTRVADANHSSAVGEAEKSWLAVDEGIVSGWPMEVIKRV